MEALAAQLVPGDLVNMREEQQWLLIARSSPLPGGMHDTWRGVQYVSDSSTTCEWVYLLWLVSSRGCGPRLEEMAMASHLRLEVVRP